MKLINPIQRNKKVVAVSLIMAFAVVFGCDFLCDLGIIDISLTHSHEQHEAATSSHDHRHEDEHDHDHHGDYKGDASSEVDECCEEETNKLYASLIKNDATEFLVNEEPILVGFTSDQPNTYTFCFHKKHNPNTLNSTLSPPILGWEIRVLHQSFLC